jgi:hypothetical protein
MGDNHIRNPEAVRDALRQVCARGELLILVTPYVRFESCFLRLDDDAFQVAATMSREDAIFGLRSSELRFRFPYGFTFLEGSISLLGLGMAKGRSSLRLSIPLTLEDNDHRAAYRVDRVGRVPVTFSTRKYDLLLGNLVNISTTGARIYAQKDFEFEEVQVEDAITVTIPLEPGIRINTKAIVRYVHGHSVGMEFRPKLDSALLQDLTRWCFRKREEDHQRSIPLAGSEVSTGHLGGGTGLASAEEGLVLVSAHPAFEDRLRDMLKDLPPLRRIPPTTQALKDLGPVPGCLLLVHLPSMGMDDRKRLRLLVEPLSGRAPFVLVGTDVENAPLFELGKELKATASYVLGPNPGSFFPRLLQGILRKHFGVGAPDEAGPGEGAG